MTSNQKYTLQKFLICISDFQALEQNYNHLLSNSQMPKNPNEIEDMELLATFLKELGVLQN